ncbi:hypothetical protein LshimejAT787_0112300 [Lyophyllum shimeji]|uniref:Uncharacterized protein n=1 Tax=Lyophyllum shimeji TaxID=47721 RepID=A0A9P3UKG0_LYOSH|nr:hypothetical protein LshimejAT787_0112300 [Lyophyllum shimeji]
MDDSQPEPGSTKYLAPTRLRTRALRPALPITRPPGAKPDDAHQRMIDDYPDIDSMLEDVSHSASAPLRPLIVDVEDGSRSGSDDCGYRQYAGGHEAKSKPSTVATKGRRPTSYDGHPSKSVSPLQKPGASHSQVQRAHITRRRFYRLRCIHDPSSPFRPSRCIECYCI